MKCTEIKRFVVFCCFLVVVVVVVVVFCILFNQNTNQQVGGRTQWTPSPIQKRQLINLEALDDDEELMLSHFSRRGLIIVPLMYPQSTCRH